MIEEGNWHRRGLRAFRIWQRERQCRRCSGRREQWREIQAVAAKLVTGLALPISGRLGRRLVGVGMRDRAHLGEEKRQHSQGRDAKFDAMRPFEQGRPLTQEAGDASTVRVNWEPPSSS